MEILDLVLKRKWFELIESGIKTEEYREIKPYWEKRLLDYKTIVLDYKMLMMRRFLIGRGIDPLEYPRGFTHVTFQLGYQKNAPRMTFEIKSISIGKGREDWGAPTGREVFIIKLGKRVCQPKE